MVKRALAWAGGLVLLALVVASVPLTREAHQSSTASDVGVLVAFAAFDGVATIANAGSNASALMLTNSPSDLGPALNGFLTQQVGRVQQLIVVGDLTTITASAQLAAATALHLRE